MNLTALTTFFKRVKARFEIPTQTQHYLLGIRNNVFTAHPVIIEVGLVETDAQVEQQKTTQQPFVDIRTNTYYLLENGLWVPYAYTVDQLVKEGVLVRQHLHLNTLTGELYYLTATGSPTRF